MDGSGPQTFSFYRPIWPSCLREAAWPRLEDGLRRAKVIFLESLTGNLIATFWAIHKLCQHILNFFGPTHSLSTVLCCPKQAKTKLWKWDVSKAQKGHFLNPPTQSICWRNIWMVPLRSKSARIDGAQPLKNADLIRRHRYRTWRFERHRRCITRKWGGGNRGERRHVSKVSLKKKEMWESDWYRVCRCQSEKNALAGISFDVQSRYITPNSHGILRFGRDVTTRKI